MLSFGTSLETVWVMFVTEVPDEIRKGCIAGYTDDSDDNEYILPALFMSVELKQSDHTDRLLQFSCPTVGI